MTVVTAVCCPVCVTVTDHVTEGVRRCRSCEHLWVVDGETLRRPTVVESRRLYDDPEVRQALGFDPHPEQAAEVTDLVWGSGLSPKRTETACNAVVCSKQCIAWSEGPLIAGEPSCAVCTHTRQSHQPPKTGKKAKR